MNKYVIDGWVIKTVEVIRESPKSYVSMEPFFGKMRERRYMKNAATIFDTWEQAHVELIGRADKEVQAARLNLERKKGQYGNIKGMKKP